MMHDAIPDTPHSAVRGWGMVLVALIAAVAAAAAVDLLGVGWRLGGGLPETIGVGGLLGAVCAAAGLGAFLRWLLLRPDRLTTDRNGLAVGMALLLGTRLAAVVLVDAPLIVDWRRYHELAVSISQGGDWFASRPSGYSLLLAVGYRAFGADPAVGEWLNLGLGAIGGLLVHAIALRAAGSRAAGVALLLFAVSPSEILMTTVLGTELAYGVLLTGVVAILLLAPPTLLRAAAAGVVLGASQYVRATSQVLAPVLAVAIGRLAVPGRRAVIGLAMAGACLLSLAPVIAANLERSGVPSLSTSSFQAWQLLIGTNQAHEGRFNADDVALVGGEEALGTPEAERIALRIALQRIVDDPLGELGLLARKFPQAWGDAHYGARWALYEDPAQDPRTTQTFVLLSQLVWALTAALAAVGAWRASPRAWPTIAVLGLVLAVFIVVHALGEANPRYHAPLVPLFCVLAGVGAAALVRPRPQPEVAG
jgi:hypothetical protein